MNYRELAQNNKIFEIRTGSHLYGTVRPDSDEDFMGVFLPGKRQVYGFLRVDEVDNSVVSKDENNKNTADARDIKYYEFRKYVRLLMDNNPNIIESIFVNQENIVYVNSFGEWLLENKKLFPYKGLKEKFCGYAFSQKHKMFIKRDNYFNLVRAGDFLNRFESALRLFEIEDQMDKSLFVKRYNKVVPEKLDFYVIGDINIAPWMTVKNAWATIELRLSRVGNREQLYLDHAYDTKFASHLIRLLLEGKELLTTGEIQFPLDYAPLLIDIRNGYMSIEAIIQLSDQLEKDIDKIESSLPNKPRSEEIENFCMDMVETFLHEGE